MARGPRYKVRFRRRREGKTDYYARYRLLLSGKPRLVVRRSNRHIRVQVVEARPEGDHTLVMAFSKELEKLGWLYSRSNTPAAYLTGFLAGLKSRKKGITEAILDIGLYRSVPGARVYAALKGFLDAGCRVPHSPEILPSDDRIRGEDIASYAKHLKEKSPEKYQRVFSGYLRLGLLPEEMPRAFEEVLEKVKKLEV
uniref:Large ribosomal subunit protein uL18 n=1 Tax=uncultured korarchaeote TaxID=161241 RepID=A0A1L2JJZ5_9CREN|nr:ribosomal protein L18 [uncultured korarchaeote]